MAFKDASIGMHVGSGGGGGIVVINDDTELVATIRNNAYFATRPPLATEPAAHRTYGALVSFIQKQQRGDGGVVFFPIGSNGGGNAGVLTLSSANIVQYTAGT